MRRTILFVLCLLLVASLCIVWAEEATGENGGPRVNTARTWSATHHDSEDNWPDFFTGLALGAGIGAAIASVSVIACSYMINRKRKNK